METSDELIVSFCEVTGSTPEKAESYLKVSDNNMEQAVSLYFSNDGAELVSTDNFTPPTTSTDNQQTNTPSMPSDIPRAPIAPRSEILTSSYNSGDTSHWIDDPYTLTGTAMGRNVPATSSSSSSSRVNPTTGIIENTFRRDRPEDDEEEILANDGPTQDKLESLFRIPSEIIFPASFQAAKKSAQQQARLLLVALHDSTLFQCHELIRDLWNNSKVQEFIKENFVFCFYSNTSMDGRQHQITYPVNSYPYFAVIDSLTGERMASWTRKMEVDEFIGIVGEVLFNHSSGNQNIDNDNKSIKGKEKKKNVTELSEEQQLELALRASMNNSSTVEVYDDENSSSDDDDDSPMVVTGTRKNPIVVDDEPFSFKSIKPIEHPEPTISGDNVTRIQIKSPDGSRVVRKFLKSDTVGVLFEHIKYTLSQKGGDDASREFDLISMRQPLFSKFDMTLSDAGLANGVVMIEYS